MPQRDVCQAAVDLVQQFEGIPDGNKATVNLDPYLDPVGIWTIGWGHAIQFQGSFVRGANAGPQATALYPDGISMDQAAVLLHADLVNAGRDVLLTVAVDLNDNEFGALTSFAFNLGIGNLRQSTLLKRLNADDRAAASDEFSKWVMAGKQVLPGLVKRRAAERALFLAPGP